MNLDFSLISYKTNNKSNIEKYHIVNNNNKVVRFKICNAYAPFGRQCDHKTKNINNQHRLNVCFTLNEIKNNNPLYLELINIITEIETFFKEVNEFIDYELISNIIDRTSYGKVIRFNLKKINNKTISKLIQIINGKEIESEWIDFKNDLNFNFEFYPLCLWIDKTNKKYGVTLLIEKVIQFIS
jgi:hypothetical protein